MTDESGSADSDRDISSDMSGDIPEQFRIRQAKRQKLLDEGKASLGALAAVWGGSGSEAYQAVQMRWDEASLELNNALQNLAMTISEAGQTMAQTEAGVTGMFA